MASTSETFSDMLSSAVEINDNTSPEAVNKELNEKTEATPNSQPGKLFNTDNSDFLFPTLIIVPMVIVLISIFTLSVSLIVKIVLVLLLLISMVSYFFQFKKTNILNPLNKFAEKLKVKKSDQKSKNLFTD